MYWKDMEIILFIDIVKAGVAPEMTSKMFTPALSLSSAVINIVIIASANCYQLIAFQCQNLKQSLSKWDGRMLIVVLN